MVATTEIYQPITPIAGLTGYRFGLFDAAPPETSADSAWLTGVTWESPACSRASYGQDPCLVDGGEIGADGWTWSDEDLDYLCRWNPGYKPIEVYMYAPHFGSEGSNGDVRGRQALNAALQLAEQNAVERFLWAELTTAVSSLPTAVASPKAALGMVEQLLAEGYGAQGVIHVNRFGATLLEPNLERDGSKLTTKLGTTVVAGGGYAETGATVTVPTAVPIIGTGALRILRGPLNNDAMAFDQERNGWNIVAQRTYVVGWDCFAVGHQGTTTGGI